MNEYLFSLVYCEDAVKSMIQCDIQRIKRASCDTGGNPAIAACRGLSRAESVRGNTRAATTAAITVFFIIRSVTDLDTIIKKEFYVRGQYGGAISVDRMA